MLIIIKALNQLKFSELMHVYAEENLKNGTMQYSHLPVDSQIREAELDFYRYLNDIFFRVKDAFYALWEVDNHYKAALRMEPYQDGWLLSGLETAPSERKRGYATGLINSVVAYLTVQQDMKIYSHVSKQNRPSITVHKKCGFYIDLDYAVFLDGSVGQNSYTLVYDSKKGET